MAALGVATAGKAHSAGTLHAAHAVAAVARARNSRAAATNASVDRGSPARSG